ncbi:polysaccharide deacetylase family protein [Spongiactinospora sp. TRM90649]|uniref:polysaccharide deacetylase family protein n=1 Tax=Spongiactinospora sp. TRM90649 TaxID=3031114 RepID=UPI0023F888B3|nr:polysaccharide deacetylase family protein [Spongiactinospora sp. TRM90649]MDF5753305.1 polysaccharide deacetylase family protein [Spongiactinospora sp. TRM90649]
MLVTLGLALAICGLAVGNVSEPARPVSGRGGGGSLGTHRPGELAEQIGGRALAARLARVQPDWPARRAVFRPRPIDCAELKCVALTFDDGPYRYTGRLLDMLARHEARATFFVVGRMVDAGGADDLRRMVAEGHELGNHSWDHAMLTDMRREGVEAELQRTQRLVRRVTGTDMRIMRPPYGATDRTVSRVARGYGLSQILWDVDTVDWRDRQPALVARRVGAAGPGTIVLLHDIHSTTVRAVPRVLARLDHEGYTFVTVSELLGEGVPGPGGRYPMRNEEELRRAARRS